MTLKYSYSDIDIRFLSDEHALLLGKFCSSNPELNDFLVKDALVYQTIGLGITYLLLDKPHSKIISYVTLAMGSVKFDGDLVLHGRRLADYPKDFPNQIPALLIGKLATDQNEEGKGGARFLVEHSVRVALECREKVGCGYLVAHVYRNPRTIDWYQRTGFHFAMKKESKNETVPMYFELPPKRN